MEECRRLVIHETNIDKCFTPAISFIDRTLLFVDGKRQSVEVSFYEYFIQVFLQENKVL